MEDFVKQTFKDVLENMIPLHKYCGVQLMEIDDGYVKLKFPYKEELIGDPRAMRLHGGFLSITVDASGGAAAMTQMQSPEDDVATADMRIDYLRPGQAKDIIAVGKITHKTSRTIFTEMQIFHEDSEDLIAVGRGVYAIKRKQI